MVKDLVDEVVETIETSDYNLIPVDVIHNFAAFLAERRYYSVEEILKEIRDMMRLPIGDYRKDFDDYLLSR